MSDFIENLTLFLTECRNDILRDDCNNAEYLDLKEKAMSLYDRLQASITPEYHVLLNDYIDALSAIGGMEVNYFYLRGLCDANKPNTQFESTAAVTPAELADNEKYVEVISACTEKRTALDSLLPSECHCLFEEYNKCKQSLLNIEKTQCYHAGLRDKKRLDKQFDRTAAKEWYALLDAFL